MLGLNRLNCRCLFIGDGANLIQNTTNSIISLNPTGRFDCTSTDGSLRLPAVFNGAIFTNTTCNTTLISSLNVSGLTTLSNATTCISSLNVSGITMLNNDTTINGVLSLKNGFWHKSMDNIERLYFSASGTSFFHSGLSAGSGSGSVFRSYAHADILTIDNSGSISCTGAITTGNFNSFLGGLRVNVSDTGNTK